jgi:hypothetical protein
LAALIAANVPKIVIAVASDTPIKGTQPSGAVLAAAYALNLVVRRTHEQP